MAEANIPLVARIMVQHGGASGSSGTSTDRTVRRQAGDTRQIQKNTQETSKSSSMGLVKMIGLLSGVGLVLGFVIKLFKNSQVTKGIFGSLFQILGAMVDVFLAPFVPYIIPVLHALADKVDVVAEWSESIVALWRDKIGPWFGELKDYIVAGDFMGAMTHIFSGIGKLFLSALEKYPLFGKILSGVMTVAKLIGILTLFNVVRGAGGNTMIGNAVAATAALAAAAVMLNKQDFSNIGKGANLFLNINNTVDDEGKVQSSAELEQNQLGYSTALASAYINRYTFK